MPAAEQLVAEVKASRNWLVPALAPVAVLAVAAAVSSEGPEETFVAPVAAAAAVAISGTSPVATAIQQT